MGPEKIEELCEEAFDDYWPGDEPWKRDEHLDTFRNGFAAGIAHLLACQSPALRALREEITNMVEIVDETS